MNQCKSVYLVVSHYKSGKPDVLLEGCPLGSFTLLLSFRVTPEWGYDALRQVPTYCVGTSVSLAQIFSSSVS